MHPARRKPGSPSAALLTMFRMTANARGHRPGRAGRVPVRCTAKFDSDSMTSSPEDPSWIGVDFVEQLGEAGSRWQRLVAVPAEVAVLTVELPFALRAHVGELSDNQFLPVVGRLKGWSFFEENHRVALDSVTKPYLRLDGWRYPFRAVCRQQLVDLGSLHFGQRHSDSPIEPASVWRTLTLSGRGERRRAPVRSSVMFGAS